MVKIYAGKNTRQTRKSENWTISLMETERNQTRYHKLDNVDICVSEKRVSDIVSVYSHFTWDQVYAAGGQPDVASYRRLPLWSCQFEKQ